MDLSSASLILCLMTVKTSVMDTENKNSCCLTPRKLFLLRWSTFFSMIVSFFFRWNGGRQLGDIATTMNFRTYSFQLSIQNNFHRFEKHLTPKFVCLALFPQKYSTYLGWYWPLTLGHVATHNLQNVSYLTNFSLYDVYVWLDSAFICVVYCTGIKHSCLYGQFKLRVMFLPMAVKS